MTVSEYPIAFAGAKDYTPEIIFPALTGRWSPDGGCS